MLGGSFDEGHWQAIETSVGACVKIIWETCPRDVVDVVADRTTWQYRVMDEPGSELSCQVITDSDDDNKTERMDKTYYPLRSSSNGNNYNQK